MTEQRDCPFCNSTNRIVDANDRAFAIRDGYPVSPGHTLVIPRRHCPDFLQLSDVEIADCFALVKKQSRRLHHELHPDGFNIGVNVGEAAGQSIFHVHIQVIPRFKGDHPHPRGGIRNVIPGKGDYSPRE